MSDFEYTSSSKPVNYEEIQRKWKENDVKAYTRQQLEHGFMVADQFLTQRYLDHFSSGTIIEPTPEVKNPQKLRVFEITKIVYDPEEQINDKFISVYSSLHNLNSSVGIMIRSRAESIKLYAITRCDENPELAGETLRSSLKGNFPGIEISESLSGELKRELLRTLNSEDNIPKSMCTVSLIPSERDDDKDKFIQGLEKFLSTMNGKHFDALLLSTPVDVDTLARRKRGFEELYSALSPHSKISMSFAHSETDSVNQGISTSFSNSVNSSVSNSSGTSSSNASGSNVGSSSNFGASGDGWNVGFGSSNGSFSSYTSGTNFSNTVSESTGRTDTEGFNKSTGRSTGDTDTTSLNFENKSVQGLMERADSQLKRIDFSESYGMWDFCAYFFSPDIAVTSQAASVYKSLMMGQESASESSHMNAWNMGKINSINTIVENIKYLVHPTSIIPAFEQYEEQKVTPTNMINGREVPIVLGFPRKSVPGVAVVEMAEFGRAVVYESPERVKRFMEFGNIYHMGVKEALRVPMDMDLLSSHCFITGSSGSGKSYATYQLLNSLLEQDVHMMVIEPAKGEYKQVFGGLKGIRIFTTDPNVYKMLRINPFQFPENLHVLTHIEKLIQIFNASWSLTAAMPAILKDAVVQSYVKCGWDIMNSIWIEGISDHKYPVFQDVLELLPKLINESDYSADAKGDYKGALLTRVKSMTSGISGLIFEKSEGIEDSILFDSNVVVDLSDIGSEETVALLMGVLIMRLGEYRQSVRKAGKDKGRDLGLNHVTVLEEAHNILKRTSKEQSQEGSNIVGKSVEMISNSIKEMRTYGEGFIIIDQSPMAVDTSAIENTSTKIIMNTPAKDACEELSSALSLSDEQARELSRLSTGVAAVFQKGWLTPVLMKIDKWDDRYEAEVKRADIQEMRLLRGKLITELYSQREKELYSPIALKRIIRDSDVDSEKKKDFEEYVNIVAKILAEKPSGLGKIDFAEMVLQILNCDGLLNVIADEKIIGTGKIVRMEEKSPGWFTADKYNDLMTRCKSWKIKFEQAFPKYAITEDASIVGKVMKTILYLKTYGDEKGNSFYCTLDHYIDNL
ncbi:MAG: ATP-binding protein [Clostridia bacterium]|nr:ATP-binding protein [Clostridia bacterium]